MKWYGAKAEVDVVVFGAYKKPKGEI